MGRSTAPFLVYVLGCIVSLGKAKQIQVGGDNGWGPGRIYTPIQASVGDSLVCNTYPSPHTVGCSHAWNPNDAGTSLYCWPFQCAVK